MKAEMHRHLTLTTNEAVARLQGNWNADVAATTTSTGTSCTWRTCCRPESSRQFPARF